MKFTKPVLKTSFNMALPAVVETFFASFIGLVDTYMVSSLGPDAVASVGLTTQPRIIGVCAFLSIGVSVSALAARRRGENRRRDANAVLITALSGVLALSAVVTTLSLIFAPDIMRLCGASENTCDNAVIYFRILMGGLVFNAVQIVTNAAMRGVGNTKITMRANVTANVVNVIFNYLLIGGNFGFPKLGVAGAAIASVIGLATAAVMSVVALTNDTRFISLPYIVRERVRPTFDAVKSIVHIAYSLFLEQLLMRVGFLATALMAASQGDAAMAAHQVCMNILSLSFSFGDGLQAAAVALIGKSLGENKPDDAKAYGSACQFLGIICSIAVALIFFFGARPFMTMFFPHDPPIVETGVVLMYIAIVTILFQIRQVIYMGCLRGAGDTLFTAILSAVSVTVIRTAVSYICGYTLGLGITGIWFGILGDQFCRFCGGALRFRTGKWTKIKI